MAMTSGTGIGTMTRRAALGAMAAGGLGFALLGPRGGGAAERQAAASGRVVLDYWEKWTRHEGDAMRRVVDAFNQSQTRIFVRYVVTADIGQKSMVAIAGGAPPDLIGLYAFNVPGYAESGALMPLDDLAPRFGVTLEMYAEGVRGVMTHRAPGRSDGPRWWACVNTAGSVALYYNRAAFREVGLDPDRGPRTIAELDEAHRRLVKRRAGNEGRGTLERVGFFHPEPGWWSWIWAYHFARGGDGSGTPGIYDAAADRATIDAPANIEAMRWMQGYSRDLGQREARAFKETFGNYFTPENPFLTGKVGMIVQGPWVANLIGAFKPDFDYGVCAFPTLDGKGPPVGHIDTDVIVIPRGARHPEASMEFIAWTQRQDMTELLATAHCKPSPLAVASESFLATHPNRGVRVHYDLFRSPRAFHAPRTRVWQQIKDEFDTQVQRVWRDEAPAEQIMRALQPRAQAILDRAADQRRRRSAGGGGVGA